MVVLAQAYFSLKVSYIDDIFKTSSEHGTLDLPCSQITISILELGYNSFLNLKIKLNYVFMNFS
ncbi:hypothetical protein SAMN06265377_3387 [Flagellimonas pacifica]|uniref:Uncharacterized protein n=1 Tax=Flagellimonas pacifica TaxID=1247520 RepID=A0A285MWH4_9FLAO|nr:hypothetical protein SAMN06265377_3387 [Allomuricauda parva]